MLQALADLQAAARMAPPHTVAALAGVSPVAGAEGVLNTLITEAGCRLDSPDALSLHPALTLAATLPDDDFDSFLLATVILVADRLQMGGGKDDLFWHWDAFRARYRTGPPRRRAAIFQGYLQLDRLGLVALFDKPEMHELAQKETDPVIAALTNSSDPDAGIVLAALADAGAVADAADTWERRGPDLAAARSGPMLAGFRHLYETQPSYAPFAAGNVETITKLPFDVT